MVGLNFSGATKTDFGNIGKNKQLLFPAKTSTADNLKWQSLMVLSCSQVVKEGSV